MTRRAILAVVACFVAIFAVAAHAEERRLKSGRVDAFLWTPDTDAAAHWPVVVFSHGIHLCANESRFITQAIAAAGYLVIAPTHADANCSFNREARDEAHPAQAPSSASNDADYGDRANDIRAALDALAADPELFRRADLSRVALAGHSLGGYTVLAMGAALAGPKLPHLKAILAFAPYTMPFGVRGDVGRLEAPVMYQTGSLDPLFTLPVAGPGGAYARSPSPKYYVEVAGAGHYSWTDGAARDKEAIIDYAIAFLDCYVKGEPEAALLRSARPGVTALRRDVRRD